MLHVAVEADERALADAFRRRAEERERPLDEQLPERLAVAVDQRLEIGDVPAGERVLDDGARRDQPRRGQHRLAALPLDVLDDRDHLAQTVERHGASISRSGGR